MDNNLQRSWQSNLEELTLFFNSDRFRGKKRHYTPSDIAPLRNSFPVRYTSSIMAHKLYKMLRTSFEKGEFLHTFGAMDPVQVINLSKYLKCVYVSGWQCSSTASTTNEPGPDFADYPVNTVPTKVDQLFKAQLFHDRRQSLNRAQMTPEERKKTPVYDYLAPMIADADAGFGGTTAVMKMTKLFIEAGAGGIHIEDQLHGTKKCGHMAGKVIVSTKSHINRLIASRLQADICGSPLVLCCRTDALSAKFIESNVDEIDHPWILGIDDPSKPDDLVTFVEAGRREIRRKFQGNERRTVLDKWNNLIYQCSLNEAKKLANSLGFEFYFDWEKPRTYEGYYRIEQGSIDFCIRRAIQFSPYCDLIWMETPKPNLQVARKFAEGVRAFYPEQMFAYNLSPSFNWDASGMTDVEIGRFCADLGKYGYVFQFITLAGFHMNALASEVFANKFKDEGMIAYVRDVQRKERMYGVDQLKHQK